MSGETVLVAKSGGVTRLTLNRPDKLNAFTLPMHTELRAALEAAAGDAQCRVVVLTWSGRAFCAGQDLAEIRPAGAGDAPRGHGAPISTQQRKTFQVLKWVGLQHRMNAFPMELSGG